MTLSLYKTRLAEHQDRCPVCLSENICGEGVDIGHGSATQEVTCQECYACWRVTYVYKTCDIIWYPPKEHA